MDARAFGRANLPHLLLGCAAALVAATGVWLAFGPSAARSAAGVTMAAVALAVSVALMGAAARGVRRWQMEARRAPEVRAQLERSLARADDYRGLFRHSTLATMVVDPERGMVLDASDRACALYGMPPGGLTGCSLDYLDGAGLELQASVQRVARLDSQEELELPVRHPDGSQTALGVRLSAAVVQDRTAVVLTMDDVTDAKAREDRLSHRVHHDALTGLANRVLFRERVDAVVARMGEGAICAHVLYLDLDNFKTVNDRLGHAAGDRLLQEVAQRLRACVRLSDTVARLGGDEFSILLESSTLEDAVHTAKRVLGEVRITYPIDGGDVVVGTSVGIAPLNQCTSAEEWLNLADGAMYAAKREGKGTYRVAGPAGLGFGSADPEGELRRALDQEQWELQYQPIVELGSGRVAGLEALVRWRHPDRGVLGPDAFLPFAEETGLSVPMGRWVLERACRDMGLWHRRYGTEHLSLTVNVSSRQLEDPEFVEAVRAALDAAELAPARLTLDVAEAVIVQQGDALAGKLQRIRDLGVQLAVDDLGGTQTSLHYVRRLPVDSLKIDPSLLSGPDADAEILRTVLGMGVNLRLSTVAERIATEAQLARARSAGYAFGQGFHLFPPLTPAQVGALLYRVSLGAELPAAAVPVHN